MPILASPVGAPAPRYLSINLPAATALVDEQLALIAELRSKPVAPGGVTPQQLAIAEAVKGFRTDRPAAIAGFQRTAKVGNSEERAGRVVLPGGSTWPELFGYGRMAAALDTLRDQRRDPKDYVYSGRFDHARFIADASARLRANSATATKYSTASLPNFQRMLTYMENDSRIMDIRWIAYMFATTYWESAGDVVIGRRPDGKPITQFQTVRRSKSISSEGAKNTAVQ